MSEEGLTLPNGSILTDEQIEAVAEAVQAFLEER